MTPDTLATALLALADEVNVPRRTWWGIVQQSVAFAIALATLYGLVVRPLVKAVAKHMRESIADVVAAQQQTNATLARVDHQLHPNGGASAHDYARKAYEESLAIRAEQRHHGLRLDHLQGEQTAMGWRLQEVTTKQDDHAAQGREFLATARVILAGHGITLPDTDTEEARTP